MRVLHAGLLERGPGAAGAPGPAAGAARRPRTDHRRSPRRPPVPLHRLHPLSRGRARRDPGRSEALPHLASCRVTRLTRTREPSTMKSGLRQAAVVVFVFAGGLATLPASDAATD